MISLSQRPLSLTQSLHKQPSPPLPPHLPPPSPAVALSCVPFTQIHDGSTSTERSQGHGHQPLGGGEGDRGEGEQSDQEEFGTQSEERGHGDHLGKGLSLRLGEEEEEAEGDGDGEAMCLVDEQTNNTLSTSSVHYGHGSVGMTRHGTVCETFNSAMTVSVTVTQIPEASYSFWNTTTAATATATNPTEGKGRDQILEEINPSSPPPPHGASVAHADEDNDQLSPTIHYSGTVRKASVSSSSSGSGGIGSGSGNSGLTPSRRKNSILSGWIDDSLPMNRTELIKNLGATAVGDGIGHGGAVEECKKVLEFSAEDDHHLYDVEDDEDEDEQEQGQGLGRRTKSKKKSTNESDISIGGMI
jgi:hypothetical protein